MTDRFYSLTVILEKDIRCDDAQPIIEAIKQFRGVLQVEGNISDGNSLMSEEREKMNFRKKLLDMLS